MTDNLDEYGDRPMCGHKYCPANRCGYMPEPLQWEPRKPKGGVGEGLGTGLPNDVDYSDLDLQMLAYLNEEEKPKPSVTVSGNGITVFRLDAEGNPVGEGLSLDGAVEFTTVMPEFNERLISGWDTHLETVTLDIDLCDVNPDLIAILTGQYPLPPYEVWGSPRLYRWLPRFIRRKIKSRWIRRGYGG